MEHSEIGRSPVIILDESKRPQLEAKLEEYNQRLTKQLDGPAQPYIPPEGRRDIIDTKMKIFVLEALLQEGRIQTHELCRRIPEDSPEWDVDRFGNACAVIDGYNNDDLSEMRGGTGLPDA